MLLTKSNIKLVVNETLSGITVSLALVPVSVAFAFVAGVPPSVALYCSIIVGFLAAIVGGRPGMITAATGALAVVMTALVIEYGIEYLFAACILMGLIQLVAGFGRLGKFIRLVPLPAIYGFVNGLAIIIFLSQLQYFKTPTHEGTLIWIKGTQLWMSLALIALTMLIIQFFPKITKAVPSTLVAIIVVTLIVAVFQIDVRTVGEGISVASNLPSFHIPNVPWTLETLKIIAPYALILAAIGLIESLITLTLVDDYTGTHGRGNLECIGQGLGNTVGGFLGAFAGCATVGPTMINLKSGGRTRLSAIIACACVLLFVLAASPWIEMVPMPALIGLMFMVVIETFAWSTFRIIHKIPRTDAFVIIAVTIISVFEDLATAVIMGVIIAALAFAWESARNIGVRIFMNKDGQKIYKIHGPLFFGSVKSFLNFFDPEHDPKEVIIDFKQSRVCDHSAIDAIDSLAEKYMEKGITVHLLYLSAECKRLLAKAAELVDVEKDPNYRYQIMSDRLE